MQAAVVQVEGGGLMAGRKSDPAKLAAMRERQAVEAPDFLGAARAGGRDGKPPRLPADSPVVPLGKNRNTIYLLDRTNQIIEAGTECKKGDLALWFGVDFLIEKFPQTKSDRKGGSYVVPGEFDQADVQFALLEDCVAEGIFNPTGKVFGRGAHRFPGDRAMLALHMGRQVMLANWTDAEGKRRRDPDVRAAGRLTHNGRDAFFPALERLPAPDTTAATAGECEDLLEFLGQWQFVERKAGPLLLLGMIVQMYICGALDWRSHMWLTSPSGSGKSTLLGLIEALHDAWCLKTEDTSEAAIRQVLGDDTLPVLLDEAEGHDKPERIQAILNLMKKSSAGAKVYRGGVDHKASEFTAQSCFLLASVMVASMRGEDRNRTVILQMLPLPPLAQDEDAFEFDVDYWQRFGRRLRRRIIDQWPRFDQTKADYHRQIMRAGFDSRWGDTYGTLLACADLALFDHTTRVNTQGSAERVENAQAGPARVAELVATIAPMMAMGRSEALSDVDRAKDYLMSKHLPGSGGRPPEPVSLWIERAMNWVEGADGHQSINEEARAKLKAHGLRLVTWYEDIRSPGKLKFEDVTPTRWHEAWLAIAYPTNQGQKEFWADSKDFAGDGYRQSLSKIEGARPSKQKIRFTAQGDSNNALLVPLKALRPDEDGG